jgi:small conductance mechanosensitive channel
MEAKINWQDATTPVIKKLNSWGIDAIKMLPNLVVAMIILVIFWLVGVMVARLAQRMTSRFSPYSHVARLVAGLSRLLVIAIGIILALSAMSLDKAVASMLAGVGIVGIALGFASRNIAGDYMAGLIIHFSHPFRSGHMIKTGDFFVYVDSIEMRVTHCRTQQGQRVIIPNRKIVEEEIINYTTLGMRRVDLKIAISWDEDLPRVEELCVKAVESLEEPWRNPNRQVEFFYEEFDGTNMDLTLRFWTQPEQQTYLKATSEALKAVSQAFKENGIAMPSSTITLDFGMPGVHSLRKQLEDVHMELPPPGEEPEAGEKPEEKETEKGKESAKTEEKD